jgi:hypothetical protein
MVGSSLDYDLGRDGSTDVALRDDGPNCSLQVVLVVMKVVRTMARLSWRESTAVGSRRLSVSPFTSGVWSS